MESLQKLDSYKVARRSDLAFVMFYMKKKFWVTLVKLKYLINCAAPSIVFTHTNIHNVVML